MTTPMRAAATIHANRHAKDGSDPVAPGAIGALSADANLTDLADITAARTALAIGPGATGVYNVKHYGAVGDGSHDDTAAIQAAIAAAHVNKGGVVYVPPGTYKTSATLTITKVSVHLIGAGAGSVLFTPSNGGPCLEVYDAEFFTEPANSHNVPIDELRGSTLQGFSMYGHIVGGSVANKVGVYYHDMHNSMFRDVKIVGFSYTGGVGWKVANTSAAIQGTEGTTWDGVQISSCAVNLYWTGSGNYNVLNNSFGYTRMHNCRFTVQSGQTMWKMDNGATLYNSDITWSANLSGASVLMDLYNAGIQSSRFCWQAEGTGVGPQLRHNSEISGMGLIDFQDGPIDCTNTLIYESPNQSHFQVSGHVLMAGFTTSYTNADRTGIPFKITGGPEGGISGIEFSEHLGGSFYVPYTQGPAMYALNQKHLWVGAFTYAPSGEYGGITFSPNGPGTEDPAYRPAGTASLDHYGTWITSGGVVRKANLKTASYTLDVTDDIVQFTGTGLTATLPSATNCAPEVGLLPSWGSKGRTYVIKNSASSGGALTLVSNGGTLLVTSLLPGSAVTVMSDGTNWVVINRTDNIGTLPGTVAAGDVAVRPSQVSSATAARTDFLAAQAVRDINTFLSFCGSKGKQAFLGEFGIPTIPTGAGSTYAWSGERSRWEGLLERVLNRMDQVGAHFLMWDTNERSATGNPQLSTYVRTTTGDYQDALSDGPVNTPTPAGLVLERHVKSGAKTNGVSPMRGVNYSMGAYGSPYAYGNSSIFSNTRDSQTFLLDVSGGGLTNYNYGGAATYAYLASRGVKYVRASIRLERLFRGSTPAAPVLDPTELTRLKAALTAAGNAGVKLLLANHGQGSFWLDDGTQGVPQAIGTAQYTVAMYANLWGVLAAALVGQSGLKGYALDNEPGAGGNPMTSATWDAAAQAAVTAIRASDMTSFMVVPVYQASVYAPEIATSTDFVTDPAGTSLMAYEAHYYADGSGTFTSSYDTLLANAKAAGNNPQYTVPDDFVDIRANQMTITQNASSAYFAYDRDSAAHNAERGAWYVNGGWWRAWSSRSAADILTIDGLTGEILMKDGTPVARAPRTANVVFGAALPISVDAAWGIFSNTAITYSLGTFSAGAINNFGTWLVDLAKGTWTMRLYWCKSNNLGISTVDISMDGGTTWIAVGTIDGYAASFTYAFADFPGIVLPMPTAPPRIRFRALSKNAASTSSPGYFQEPIVADFVRTA